MEQLLRYAWQNRLCCPFLRTSKGEKAEVIDPGVYHHGAGPHFLQAKVRIGELLWAGDVEVLLRSSQWYEHHHESDCAFKSVILLVVGEIDQRVFSLEGKELAQAQISLPKKLEENYRELLSEAAFPRCFRGISSMSAQKKGSFLAPLWAQRLEKKTSRVESLLEKTHGDWERAFFITLSRNFGFGANAEAFEQWAWGIDLSAVGKHRDSLLQVEAFFLGQAGLLEEAFRPQAKEPKCPKGELREKTPGESGPKKRGEEAARGAKEGKGLGSESPDESERESHADYFEKLQREYRFLQRKFSLSPMDPGLWRFSGLRPQNFPTIRLSQLALLFVSQRVNFSTLSAAPDAQAMRSLFRVGVTPFWETHYAFSQSGKGSKKILQDSSLNLILINTVAPLLFAYARVRADETLRERALNLLESLPPERNSVIKSWERAGLKAAHAASSQALLELKEAYCRKNACLLCRFGAEYLRKEATP